MQIEIIIRQNLRTLLNKIVPYWFIEKEPMGQIGLENQKLSWAYNKVTKYGYLPKSRQINYNIKRQYFEKQCGMVIDDDSRSSNFMSSILYWLLIAIVAYGCYELGRYNNNNHYTAKIRPVITF